MNNILLQIIKIMKIYFSYKDEKIIKIHFSSKNKLLGICMFLSKLTICIHIPNIKRVHKVNCMKANDSRGVHVYLFRFE